MTDHYEDSGILFKNEKHGNEKAPDWTGKINVAGVEYRLAAWIKPGKKGKFITLKVSDLEPKSDLPPTDPPPKLHGPVSVNDLPF